MSSLAFVGCAHIHTPGFVNEILQRQTPVAAVFDHDQERAHKTAENLNCRVASLDEICDDTDVRGIVVTSETNRHLELVQRLNQTDKALFIEKPIAPDGATSARIAALVGDRVFHTGYRMRGEAAVQTVKRMVEEGAFGQVTRVRAAVCHNGALGGWFDGEWRWMADRGQAGVGAFGDLGTHGLDLLMWLFGPVALATGTLGMGTARYDGCEEFGEAMLRFESGVVGTLAASWDDVACPVRLEIAGTKQHAILAFGELRVGSGDLQPVELDSAVSAGFSAFLDWFEGKPAALISAAEAARVDAAMQAIYDGAEQGRFIAPL